MIQRQRALVLALNEKGILAHNEKGKFYVQKGIVVVAITSTAPTVPYPIVRAVNRAANIKGAIVDS